MNNIRFSHVSRFAFVAGVAIVASSAFAGDISANYSYYTGITNVNFMTDFGSVVAHNGQGTTQFYGNRTGGSDTLVPNNFPAYCVEIGETLGQGGNYHPNVFNLLGSSTNGGGISGPVLFDATRTMNLECLWGTFFPLIGGNGTLSAAFQLAQWELTFDNDVTLVGATGARFWVDGSQFQAGITDVAESWLTDIRNGSATTKQKMALLTGPGIQDIITPVPEPASFLALGLGGAMVALRRRKKA